MRRLLEALKKQSAEMDPPPAICRGLPVDPYDFPAQRTFPPFRWTSDGLWPADAKAARRRAAEQSSTKTD